MKQPIAIVNDSICVLHVPKSEQGKEWLRLLKPLIKARLERENPEHSPILTLFSHKNDQKWRMLKNLIEFVLTNVEGAESILSRTHEVKGAKNNPDGVFYDMWGEMRAVQYLVAKGFANIRHIRKNNVDFLATFNNQQYGIEVKYIRGPNFKTQEGIFLYEDGSLVYRLDSKKIINRLKSTYQEKEKQVIRHGYNQNNSIIIIVSDLKELYEPWLNHDQIDVQHPVGYFVDSTKYPCVVLGPGTVYEPDKGFFQKLHKFEWSKMNFPEQIN